MKVEQHRGVAGPGPGAVPRTGRDAGGARAATGAGTQSADRVSLSEEARRLARLRAEVGNLDEVREQKVAELRGRVAEGRYSADFTAVARKFLRELLGDLLG